MTGKKEKVISGNMDLSSIKESITPKVYHLISETKVPLHKHDDKDEIFYCIKGSSSGVLENEEIELAVGKPLSSLLE